MATTQHFRIQKHTTSTQHIRQYPRGTRNVGDQLQLSVNQYIPKDNIDPQPGDVTLIAAHANGINKELYEPLFDDIYDNLTKKHSVRIRSIWIADVAWQGESYVFNEAKLGNDPGWNDHARDLLHLTNVFRDQMPKPIFGLGHSLGGNNLVNLSIMHPNLFSGLILMDPVIQAGFERGGNGMPAYMSTFRRDIWPSRDEAAASFKKNKFYQRWDPRFLERYIKHSLRVIPSELYPERPASLKPSSSAESSSTSPPQPVTLTTPKHQEVFTFSRAMFPPSEPTFSEEALRAYKHPRAKFPDIPDIYHNFPFYNPAAIIAFKNLPNLRPRVLYLFANESDLSAPPRRKEKMETTGIGVGGSRYPGAVDDSPEDTANAVQERVLEGAGHFFPFEKPKEVAEHAGLWLNDALERWRRETAAEREE